MDYSDDVFYTLLWLESVNCLAINGTVTSMEARFRHWIKKNKRLLRLFISQFWLFFTELWDINSQLWVIKSELRDIKSELRDMFSELRVYISQLWLFNSQLRVYITQFWEKKSEFRVCISQLWEKKAQLYIYIFLFSGRNWLPYTSLPVILNCVPKMNKAFMGLERHGGKWLMTTFSFWYGVTL